MMLLLRTAAAVGALCVALAGTAHAQSDADIEALIAETSDPGTAMAVARTQADSGDVTGATATLEAALLANPNAHDARLLYAGYLCRLGDVQAARIEVAKLDRQQFSSAAYDEANAACGNSLSRPAEAEQGRGSGLAGEAYVGLAYDGDAAGAITLQTDFLGGANDDDGLSLIAGARLGWRGDGYTQSGDIYFGVQAVTKHDISGPSLDYDIGELRLGYGSGSGSVGWSLGPVFRHVRLFNDPYVTEYGGQGELLFLNDRPGKIRLRMEGVKQDYDNGALPGNAGDGFRGVLSLAYVATLANRGQVVVGIAGELKNADIRNLGYRGGHIFGSLYVPFENNHYATINATLRHINFRGSGFGDRKDTRGFLRGAYGIPLGSGGIFVEGAASYTFRNVDITSFADFENYNSLGGELRLIVRF